MNGERVNNFRACLEATSSETINTYLDDKEMLSWQRAEAAKILLERKFLDLNQYKVFLYNLSKETSPKEEVAQIHGTKFAEELDGEFSDEDPEGDELFDATLEDEEIYNKPTIRERLTGVTQRLVDILSSNKTFYIVGLIDGIIITLMVEIFFL